MTEEEIEQDLQISPVSELNREKEEKVLNEFLEEYNAENPRGDSFRVVDGNKNPLTRKLNRFNIWLKCKTQGAKQRCDVRYMDCIHISTKLGAIFFGGAFVDKYSQVYDFADRKYTKRFNPVNKVPAFYPDGKRGEVLLNVDYHYENIKIPNKIDELVKIGEEELELGRIRLVQDDGTKENITPDDRQLKLLAISILFSFLGGLGCGVLGWMWISSISIGF